MCVCVCVCVCVNFLPRNLNLDTTQQKHLLKNCEHRETHDGSKD